MTRLESYLKKNCVSVEIAVTTNSKYYKIRHAIIRYSDHVSVDYSKFDVQIIEPTGSFSRLYMFGLSGNSKLATMTMKEIIGYLPYASLNAQLMDRTVIREVSEKPAPNTIVTSKLDKNPSYAHIIFRLRKPFTDKEINHLPAMMGMEFGNGSGINASFKSFLKRTPLLYQEFLNLFKMVIIDDEANATKEILERSLNKVKSLMVE